MSTRSINDRYQVSASYLARIIHRLSGIVLAIYMLVYIWEWSSIWTWMDNNSIQSNDAAFDATMLGYNTTFWHIAHALVVALVIMHALTGLRVMLIEGGIASQRFQRASFWLSVIITIVLFVMMFVKVISTIA